MSMQRGQMHAAVLHELGQAPRYERFPAPVATDAGVVVTVTAAALKPSDRWMARGIHYAPTTFPLVVGLDGVGRLEDGARVAFFGPISPYGGMGEQALVRRGNWFPVPESADDVTAAAILNPGGAAWKSVVWEGKLAAGQSALILGATGASGRIAAQIAQRQGARVVVAGRNQHVLDELVARGADAAIRVDCQPDTLAAAIAAHGPYDLIVDYLWGAPAEAVFAALMKGAPQATHTPHRTRYIVVGMTAGDAARLPAMTLRRAPVELVGSGIDGAASLAESAEAFAAMLAMVARGEITLDVAPIPLANVEHTWNQAGSDRRVVYVP